MIVWSSSSFYNRLLEVFGDIREAIFMAKWKYTSEEKRDYYKAFVELNKEFPNYFYKDGWWSPNVKARDIDGLT